MLHQSRSRAKALMNTHFPSALKCKQNFSATKNARMTDLRLADLLRDAPGEMSSGDPYSSILLNSRAPLSFLMGVEGKLEKTIIRQLRQKLFFFYNNSPFVTPTKQHLHRSCCNPDMKRYWSMHWSELWISQPSTRHSQKKPKKGLQKKMMQKSDARHGDFSHCIHRDVFFQSSRATAM